MSEQPQKPPRTALQIAKGNWYKSHSLEVNRSKLIKQILAGKRSPSMRTLKKYGLLDDTNGDCPTVKVPNKPKFRIIDNFTTKPDVINVVAVNKITPTVPFDPATAATTGKDISNWCMTELPKMQKSDGAFRTAKTITDYAKVPFKLNEMRGQPYDENANVLPLFMDAHGTIKALETYKTRVELKAATKSKFLKALLFILQNYPKFLNINKDLIKVYEAEMQRLGGEGDAELMANKEVRFVWSYLRRLVREFYGADSYEYLMMLIYSEIHARDNLALMMAYKPEDMSNEKTNYLYLDREREKATVFLNYYKTVQQYGKQGVVLRKHTYDLIVKLHPDDSKTSLFPTKSDKLSSWVVSFFKKIPQLKDEGIGITYLRHSIVSSALAELNPNDPDYAKKVQALAAKTMHNVKSQQRHYLHPLKDGNGNPINIDQYAFDKAYDEPTIAGQNINEGGAEEEEVGSRPARRLEPIVEAPDPKDLPMPSTKLLKPKSRRNTRAKELLKVATRKSARLSKK